ncbi:MAG TPA: ion channel [Pyrinomonadaceae bacterium]|nr:ion channel [Pyrinomonadaceae bacterium]
MAETSSRQFLIVNLILCAVSEGVVLFAWLKSGEFFGSEGSIWLCVLFGLPITIQVFGSWHLHTKFENNHNQLKNSGRQNAATGSNEMPKAETGSEPDLEHVRSLASYYKFYLITMGICLLTYSLFWAIYVNGQQFYLWETAAWDKGLSAMTPGWSRFYFGLSVLALLTIALLLCLVMWMTRAIIGENKTKTRFEFLNPDHLKRGAAEAPFLTLIFFITVFLGVSYLFGFSFAFHDKARLLTTGGSDHKEPALVMGSLTAGPTALPEPSPLPTRTRVATLTFDIGTSVPDADSEEQLSKAVTGIQEMSNNDKAVRILLIGSADLRQIESPAYQSNYELAEARAQNAKHLILEKLSTSKFANVLRNLEWTCLAQPNEGLEKPGHHARKRIPANYEGKEDRTVHVFLIDAFEAPAQLLVRNVRSNHLKPLRLMDYVYFANYTITTTGYGDIVPNTTYAKFICSFANICEVLFLVVFFNALLSLAGAMTISATARKVNVLHEKWSNGPPRNG